MSSILTYNLLDSLILLNSTKLSSENISLYRSCIFLFHSPTNLLHLNIVQKIRKESSQD